MFNYELSALYSNYINQQMQPRPYVMHSQTFDSLPSNEWVTHQLIVAKYPKDDLIGMFLGYYSLLVYEIQAIYITLSLRNRDMLTFYCCFTHLLSEILNYVLKHLIKQPRPEHGAPSGGLFEGKYGMPSQHCHCFAYLITMVLLLVFHYYKEYICWTKKLASLIISLSGLSLQVWGRLYLKYHTPSQCIVGVTLGILSALSFYTVGLYLFMPHAERLCRLWILRIFAFRKDLITPPALEGSQRSSTPIFSNKNRNSANVKSKRD